ncbi:MAG: EAL domain-containing protein, partial [Gammaproteobacteria bacterium]|nr:EAL domain-containing protein [Gammaproteobacteria bacterium]
ARTSFNPEQLEIEITESALMETGRDAIVIINSLRRLGISIAIDDFGTGYSSLSYLKHYAIDKLKIDHSFVKDLPQNMGDREIISTIISMGCNMDLSVLAEGVETKAQFELLKAQGCHYFQGYYFGTPKPVHTLNHLLTI